MFSEYNARFPKVQRFTNQARFGSVAFEREEAINIARSSFTSKFMKTSHQLNYKQLLDEVSMISGIIKVEVCVIGLSRMLRLITLTESLIIPDIAETESNNCY